MSLGSPGEDGADEILTLWGATLWGATPAASGTPATGHPAAPMMRYFTAGAPWYAYAAVRTASPAAATLSAWAGAAWAGAACAEALKMMVVGHRGGAGSASRSRSARVGRTAMRRSRPKWDCLPWRWTGARMRQPQPPRPRRALPQHPPPEWCPHPAPIVHEGQGVEPASTRPHRPIACRCAGLGGPEPTADDLGTPSPERAPVRDLSHPMTVPLRPLHASQGRSTLAR
jgi:hypothetical protein